MGIWKNESILVMKKIKNFISFNVISKFVKKPEKKLLWSVEDFEKGKRWARTVPDPENPNRSLWDKCYSREDSVETLHKLNQYI
jgi:hypothetical protein